ncbi:hypothetical protein [Paraburkholderia acidisoli]|uniref:Lipoprotein n=1 Tax=Paraburkholderia acidisoli TaxID=2571748 RepID=A0A7Z2JEA2_9BURK|nr:hypothetical protein [Paraburkholderia acidisoli]QGZ62107.1 hypothetical protein FAZ98_10410 [Paraburkholderia acidisoli]
MKKAAALFCLTTLVAGCVSTSEVTQIGKDTYTVGTTARGGLNSRAEIMATTVKIAAQYCTSLNKKMQLSHSDASGVQGWTPVETDIVFQCLDETDPGYGRVTEHRDIGAIQVTH